MPEVPDIEHVYGVVLAGGSGTRFWPLSREFTPKQLLKIFGTESLIAQAVHRILAVTGDGGRVRVVAGEAMLDELRNDLSANSDERFLRLRYVPEPLPRNTAPAIAFAAAVLEREDPDATMIVLPSDHRMEAGPGWTDAMSSAVALARSGRLVTLGITPTRPETGYGYIELGESLPEFEHGSARPRLVRTFVEKPGAAQASRLVSDGRHLWNAGIFVMRCSQALDELAALSTDGARIVAAARTVAAMPEDERTGETARALFGGLPSLPIDVALLERSPNVAVVPVSLEWSDVGSLTALEAVAEADGHGNVRLGRGVDVDSEGCVVYGTDRLVATLGLSDVMVVDTIDATLVLAKDRAQDVRAVVDALRRQGAEEVAVSKTSLRPWGLWKSLLDLEGARIKLIEVKPGARLSLQRHRHRSEHWVVVAGEATVTRGEETFQLHTNESTFIPAGTVHRLGNDGTGTLRIIEVQVGGYVGEDDIERIEDDFARGTGGAQEAGR